MNERIWLVEHKITYSIQAQASEQTRSPLNTRDWTAPTATSVPGSSCAVSRVVPFRTIVEQNGKRVWGCGKFMSMSVAVGVSTGVTACGCWSVSGWPIYMGVSRGVDVGAAVGVSMGVAVGGCRGGYGCGCGCDCACGCDCRYAAVGVAISMAVVLAAVMRSYNLTPQEA